MTDRAVRIDLATDAIVNIDLQPTFMPGGGLPVAGGDEIIPLVQRLNLLFPPRQRYATLDKHPRGHISLASSYKGLAPYSQLTAAEVASWTAADNRFAAGAHFRLPDLQSYLAQVKTQTLWPDHGLIGTPESELHPDLVRRDYRFVLIKGTNPRCDSYSGLRDNLRHPTGLGELLHVDGVKRIFLTGLALDFCVGFTALDARDYGFEVFVIEDATRAVALPGTVEAMRAAFLKAGVRLIQSEDLIAF
ncbi:MAG: isochorismatase family protein [Patescibacteria group bacterium]|jgi:nicotinamidase/pyrazinamidase